MAPRYDDVDVGHELPAQTFTIRRADLVRYAGASGDFNVIHWNQRVATSVGLPDVIAHGMLTMALAARVVTDWAVDPGRVREYGVRFTRPVPVPDTDEGTEVVITGVIKEVTDDGLTKLELTATCNGEKVLSLARATIRKR